MSGSRGEFQDLINKLVERARAYGMEVGKRKESQIMTNSMDNIGEEININVQKFVEVTSLKYLGVTLYKG